MLLVIYKYKANAATKSDTIPVAPTMEETTELAAPGFGALLEALPAVPLPELVVLVPFEPVVAAKAL